MMLQPALKLYHNFNPDKKQGQAPGIGWIPRHVSKAGDNLLFPSSRKKWQRQGAVIPGGNTACGVYGLSTDPESRPKVANKLLLSIAHTMKHAQAYYSKILGALGELIGKHSTGQYPE